MKTHGELEWVAGDRNVFAVRAAPYVMVKVKRLLPRANVYQRGAITVGDTPEIARDLEWIVARYPLVMNEQTRARLGLRAGEHRDLEEEVDAILAGRGHGPIVSRLPAREPRDYQVVAADLAAATGRLLLLDVVGLGKSMSSLLVLRDVELLPAVVICYPHLEKQWAEEVEETFPDLFVHAVTTLQPYDPEKRRGGRRRPDVLIVPWSKLRGWGHHLRGQARTVIFDEAQELRTGPASQKYGAAEEIAAEALCSLELTATPVYNYGSEIYNLVAAIAPDVLGSREEFMREWCGGSDMGSHRARVHDPAGLGLYLRDQGVMLRRTRRDVGRELPATERIPHVVDADESVLGDSEIVQLADVVLGQHVPRQKRFLAAGELDWKLRRLTGLAKSPYVAAFVDALLEQEDDKIVLYGWHRDVYDQWRMRLALHEPVFYTGTESKKQKSESFKRFVDGDSRVLIVSLRAGAGLDGLQGASRTCVFGELDWSPGVHEQCIGRLERDGMGEHVTAFFLVAEAGSDPVMLETLGLKRSQSEPLVDPDAPPFQQAEQDEARVVRLAEYIRARHR